MEQSHSSTKLWGGRFQADTNALVEAFSESVSFDARLWRQDIAGSSAHARMLGRIDVLTENEVTSICDGLNSISADIEAGKFQWDAKLEDVHMNIESALTARIGEAGKKLHTGRSRNDQIATDMRLYVRDAIDELLARITRLEQALLDKAEQEIDSIMPGFTHLQVAQPVSFAHHLLAWREQILRDGQRLSDCRKRTNVLPLGSAALAGTPYPLDRAWVAKELGFDAMTENSMDAVSDRDFVIEFTAACTTAMLHLSRWSEELVLWASPMFGFVNLPDDFCTGSSIMPNKKNPDVPELVRGKTGRVVGDLNALMVLTKAQPLAYNRDNQEDKPPLFDAHDTLTMCIELYAALVPKIESDPARMRTACAQGFPTATDLADYLATKGLPFREAHRIVGEIVATAEKKNVELTGLSLETLREFSRLIEADVFDCLSLEASLAARNTYGGTAPTQIRAAIARARNAG